LYSFSHCKFKNKNRLVEREQSNAVAGALRKGGRRIDTAIDHFGAMGYTVRDVQAIVNQLLKVPSPFSNPRNSSTSGS
jgi:hypothetical protein